MSRGRAVTVFSVGLLIGLVSCLDGGNLQVGNEELETTSAALNDDSIESIPAQESSKSSPTLKQILMGCDAAAVVNLDQNGAKVAVPLRGFGVGMSVDIPPQAGIGLQIGRDYLFIISNLEVIVLPVSDELNGGVDIEEILSLEMVP